MYIPRQPLPLPQSYHGDGVTDTNAFLTGIPPNNQNPSNFDSPSVATTSSPSPSATAITQPTLSPSPYASIVANPDPPPDNALDPKYVIAIVVSLLLTLFIACAIWFLYSYRPHMRQRRRAAAAAGKRASHGHHHRGHRRGAHGGSGESGGEGGGGAPSPPPPVARRKGKKGRTFPKGLRLPGSKRNRGSLSGPPEAPQPPPPVK